MSGPFGTTWRHFAVPANAFCTVFCTTCQCWSDHPTISRPGAGMVSSLGLRNQFHIHRAPPWQLDPDMPSLAAAAPPSNVMSSRGPLYPELQKLDAPMLN